MKDLHCLIKIGKKGTSKAVGFNLCFYAAKSATAV